MKKLFILGLIFCLPVSAGQLSRTAHVSRDITLSVSTGAYSDGDQLGTPFEITRPHYEKGGYSGFDGITVKDADDQGAAFDILLFDDLLVITSADNEALAISDAEMNDKFIARGNVVAGDYTNLANNQVAHANLGQHNAKLKNGSTSFWGIAVSRGTPTYGGGELQLILHFHNF